MATTDDHKADADSLREQLSQLNERCRWYSSQLWQIPFAFLTLLALTTGTVIEKTKLAIGLTLLVVGCIGIAVIFHMRGLSDGERRAVLNLQKIEDRLYLEQTALYTKRIWSPFRVAVVLATAVCFLVGIYLLVTR